MIIPGKTQGGFPFCLPPEGAEKGLHLQRTGSHLCAAIADRLTFGGNTVETEHRLLPPRSDPGKGRADRRPTTAADLPWTAPPRLFREKSFAARGRRN